LRTPRGRSAGHGKYSAPAMRAGSECWRRSSDWLDGRPRGATRVEDRGDVDEPDRDLRRTRTSLAAPVPTAALSIAAPATVTNTILSRLKTGTTTAPRPKSPISMRRSTADRLRRLDARVQRGQSAQSKLRFGKTLSRPSLTPSRSCGKNPSSHCPRGPSDEVETHTRVHQSAESSDHRQ
jgi:hypothetical protein